MRMTDDPQTVLDLWETDHTQWIVTDGCEYAVGTEQEALHVLTTTVWDMTSPEELRRQIRN